MLPALSLPCDVRPGPAKPFLASPCHAEPYPEILTCGTRNVSLPAGRPIAITVSKLGGELVQYEVIRDRNTPDDWRVEAINHDGDGECYVTIFSGPNAEDRAKEYATWLSAGKPQHAETAAV